MLLLQHCTTAVCFLSLSHYLPEEGDEVSVRRDAVHDPVGEGNLAHAEEVFAADRVLDHHLLKVLVEESEKGTITSYCEQTTPRGGIMSNSRQSERIICSYNNAGPV